MSVCKEIVREKLAFKSVKSRGRFFLSFKAIFQSEPARRARQHCPIRAVSHRHPAEYAKALQHNGDGEGEGKVMQITVILPHIRSELTSRDGRRHLTVLVRDHCEREREEREVRQNVRWVMCAEICV